MPSRREAIRMTPAQIDAYLRAGRRIILVTNGSDGFPHPVPMNYGVDGQGRLLVTSFARSRKVRNLERDSRAALLVESGQTYRELKAVIGWCDAEIIRDPDAIAALLPLIRAESALAQSVTPAMNAQVRASLAKRVILRFAPRRFASWDHARLDGLY